MYYCILSAFLQLVILSLIESQISLYLAD